jgi:hypothetical protein
MSDKMKRLQKFTNIKRRERKSACPERLYKIAAQK